MAEPFLVVDALPGEAGYHARFAARVMHWPFSRLAEHVWVDRDDEFKVQLQLLDRQLRFITALHPGDGPLAHGRRQTVDLRYVHRPGTQRVDCVLVGKAYAAAEAEAAQAAARALWETAATAMPVGYELAPAGSAAEFAEWSGADIIAAAADSRQWAEVRRPAEFLFWTDEAQVARYLPVVYPFRWEASGWDVVWAAMARLAEPALISSSLRPVLFPAADERVLSDLVHDLNDVAGAAQPPLSQRAAEAAGWYQTYALGLRTAYAVRVAVLGAPALRWTLRSALSGPAWSLEGGPPGGHHIQAELAEPAEAEWPAARRNLEFLEHAGWGPNPWGQARLVPAIEALRYLVDPAGALCAFRLPLLPPAGFPGVEIGQEINLGR
ncbi:MAG: hypothetical protein JNK29_10335 [Anaerolineales bacterium]|nr:hypothetical protein [Anaerolineales bacterium]